MIFLENLLDELYLDIPIGLLIEFTAYRVRILPLERINTEYLYQITIIF